MKIAYARFNQNTDLDIAIGSVSSRCTEERLGIIEGCVESGHEVTIASYVSGKHRHVFDGKSLGSFDNTWMTSLRYDMNPKHADTYDCIIVETASANTMYSFKRDGVDTPFIEHFSDLLYYAKGVPIIIAHMGQKGLAYPFTRLCGRKGEDVSGLSHNNLRVLFNDIDICNDNPYILWTKAHTAESFLKAFENQYCVPGLDLCTVNTPIGYSPRYDKQAFARNYDNCDYDLVYIGRADRPERIEKIHMYYDNPGIDSLLVGKGWDKEEWQNNVEAPGQVGFQGDVYDIYQQGAGCVLCLDKELAEAGLYTSRNVQAVMSGCMLMVDSDIQGASNWAGDEFVVSSQEDVVDLLDDVYRDDALVDVNEYQKSLVPKWKDVVIDVLEAVK